MRRRQVVRHHPQHAGPGRRKTASARGRGRDTPGYAGGGNKFDLTKWDDAYFKRLKAFLTQAGERGESSSNSCLFCPFYEDSMWKLSPMNAANNVNGVGKVARDDVYNRDKNGDLQAIQEALTSGSSSPS